jgi:GTP-binding protein HflX
MILGNLKTVSNTHLKRLKKLAAVRVNPEYVLTEEVKKRLWELSFDMSRQLGLLLNRSGSVESVVVGEREEITLPLLSTYSLEPGHLRRIRFVRTELNFPSFDNDDLLDLALLRLDALSVVFEDGFETIYLLPPRSSELIQYDIVRGDFKGSFFDFINALEEEIASVTKRLYPTEKPHQAVLTGVFPNKELISEHMDELSELALSADIEPAHVITQTRSVINPRTVLGGGKLSEIFLTALLKGCDTIIFDNILTPTQLKEITNLSPVDVMDRTELILTIFANRAKSNEGRLRVELARLNYILPHLSGIYGKALSRITGGKGVKGPGETKLELDHRYISSRIDALTKSLKDIEKGRATRRKLRIRNNVPVIAIVGYTNAGKSTLLNTLTDSDVYADSMVFATLDTSAKRLRFPNEREVIITDTVGFIRDMPKGLAGAFKSTLEELYDANLLLHLVDASSAYAMERIGAVKNTLREMGLNEKPQLLVFNKSDLLNDLLLEMRRSDSPEATFISAKDKNTLPPLLERISQVCDEIIF